METELLKLILESASGTTILALGVWYIITRMRNGRGDTNGYVTKGVFYETVETSRKDANTRQEKVLEAIGDLGKEVKEAAEVDRQNLFDHVSNHGD